MIRALLILWTFTFVWQINAQQSDFEHIDFSKADKIAKSLKGEDLSNLPYLSFRLTNGLETDAEKFRAIYYWVCHNIRNDYNMMLKNERKRYKFRKDTLKLEQWNDKFKKEVFKKLLKQNRTVCTGYAFIVTELCKLADLESVIINGFGKTRATPLKNMKTPNHTWNAVKLDGKWYLSDATWSAGFIDGETYGFEFNYNNDYFLMSPEQFAEEHLPLEEQWTLLPPTSN